MSSNTLSLLGQRISYERLKQNLTQVALSQRSGVAYSTLRKIEAKGIGALGDYVEILDALGQIEQLEAWASVGQHAHQPKSASESTIKRKRARSRPERVLTEASLPKTFGSSSSSPTPAALSPTDSPKLSRSVQLGLDFPYDWSNPCMNDHALIGAVLSKARFMDVSKVFAHFGMPTVERIAAELGIDLHTGVLGALMPGIQRGEKYVSNA